MHKHIFRITGPEDSTTLGLRTPEPRRIAPAVVFDGVSFAFDEQVVLRDVSFACRSEA